MLSNGRFCHALTSSITSSVIFLITLSLISAPWYNSCNCIFVSYTDYYYRSKISIKSLLQANNIQLLVKSKKQSRKIISEPKFDARDLLKRNFKSDTYLEKVGIDGTWFKNLIINKQNSLLLVEIATDISSNSIVGWKVNQSKNAITVLFVVNQVSYLNYQEHKLFATIIQSDLGSGNVSQMVTNSFKNLIHSLSLAGFKGNQVSEF